MARWFLLANVLLMAGCAHTGIYKDADLKDKTGFRYYTGKPYVLVSNTGAKDKPTEVSVVYLPDLDNPQFAVSKPGWGSSDFSITVSNGVVSQVGQKMDSKGPETLAAIGGIASSVGGLAKALAEAGKIRTEASILEEQSLAFADRLKVAGTLESVANDLDGRYLKSSLPTTIQLSLATSFVARLREAAKSVKDPAGDIAAPRKELKEILDGWDGLTLGTAGASPRLQEINEALGVLKKELTNALKILSPPEPAKPSFQLFEIKIEKGKTHLVEVMAQP